MPLNLSFYGSDGQDENKRQKRLYIFVSTLQWPWHLELWPFDRRFSPQLLVFSVMSTQNLKFLWQWGYRGGSPTAVQAWQPCPLWD